MALWMLTGVMPCSSLYFICLARRRLVSSMANFIESVIRSAYMITLPFDVARGAADGLDQGRAGAQEAFLVRIQDGNQRDFGQVQTFAQQVDAHQHVEHAQAQVAQDADALERLHLRVQVVDLHAQLLQVLGQVLRHALGQRGHQDALAFLHPLADLADQVVHLPLGRAHFHLGVDQAGRADDLLDDLVGVLHLVGAGRGRGVDGVAHAPARTRRTSAGGYPSR